MWSVRFQQTVPYIQELQTWPHYLFCACHRSNFEAGQLEWLAQGG
jgi:hypothetical protein